MEQKCNNSPSSRMGIESVSSTYMPQTGSRTKWRPVFVGGGEALPFAACCGDGKRFPATYKNRAGKRFPSRRAAAMSPGSRAANRKDGEAHARSRKAPAAITETERCEQVWSWASRTVLTKLEPAKSQGSECM